MKDDDLVAGVRVLADVLDGKPLCTGIAATWCPVHGDCTCHNRDEEDRPDGLNDDACALHSKASDHADAAMWT